MTVTQSFHMMNDTASSNPTSPTREIPSPQAYQAIGRQLEHVGDDDTFKQTSCGAPATHDICPDEQAQAATEVHSASLLPVQQSHTLRMPQRSLPPSPAPVHYGPLRLITAPSPSSFPSAPGPAPSPAPALMVVPIPMPPQLPQFLPLPALPQMPRVIVLKAAPTVAQPSCQSTSTSNLRTSSQASQASTRIQTPSQMTEPVGGLHAMLAQRRPSSVAGSLEYKELNALLNRTVEIAPELRPGAVGEIELTRRQKFGIRKASLIERDVNGFSKITIAERIDSDLVPGVDIREGCGISVLEQRRCSTRKASIAERGDSDLVPGVDVRERCGISALEHTALRDTSAQESTSRARKLVATADNIAMPSKHLPLPLARAKSAERPSRIVEKRNRLAERPDRLAVCAECHLLSGLAALSAGVVERRASTGGTACRARAKTTPLKMPSQTEKAVRATEKKSSQAETARTVGKFPSQAEAATTRAAEKMLRYKDASRHDMVMQADEGSLRRGERAPAAAAAAMPGHTKTSRGRPITLEQKRRGSQKRRALSVPLSTTALLYANADAATALQTGRGVSLVFSRAPTSSLEQPRPRSALVDMGQRLRASHFARGLDVERGL